MANLNEAFNIIQQPNVQPKMGKQPKMDKQQWKDLDLKRLCKCGSEKREHHGSTSTNSYALSHAFMPIDGYSQLGVEYFK
jgi:hypothetical protein